MAIPGQTKKPGPKTNPAIGQLEPADYAGRASTNRLTPREMEVLKLIVEGNSSKQVARRLGISFKTVDCHRTRLMQKLDVHKTASLVHYAIRQGLIEP